MYKATIYVYKLGSLVGVHNSNSTINSEIMKELDEKYGADGYTSMQVFLKSASTL
jgi:hypothetical protein